MLRYPRATWPSASRRYDVLPPFGAMDIDYVVATGEGMFDKRCFDEVQCLINFLARLPHDFSIGEVFAAIRSIQ